MRIRRKRTEDKVYRLEKEIKELKERNRSLERQLKQAHRHKELVENTVDVYELEKKCRECGKGSLEEVNIGNRRFERCSICGWRSKTKKI